MPSGGALSNPNDKALVTSLEDKMIEAYGTALVEVKCKAAGGKAVNLQYKMLRHMHVGALFAAVERYQVASLDLDYNQLGAAGGAQVVAALKTNTTLTTLKCAQLGRPSNQVPRVGVLVRPHRHATLAALALVTFLCRVRSLNSNNLGPAAGMALAEVLNSNTTLKTLKSAALPSRTHTPVRHVRTACTLAALAHLTTFLCRVRSLNDNKLGPEGGMAFAEVLKGNTTLTSLGSAALPSNPLARAPRPHSIHVRCTRPVHLPLPCAQPRREQPRPRGRHGARRGAQGQHDPHVAQVCCPAISNPPARASQALDSHPPFRAFHPPPLLGRVSTPPRPRRERDQPFPACAPDQSCTRTAHTRPAHTRSTWPPPRQHPRRCHPRPHPAWTASFCSRVGGVCACTHPRAPARRRLMYTGLDDDAKQALKAAAGSGLELIL
eukprot:scaffold31616_cov59-Phaeocystis_antarctica.AAC.1